MKTENDLTPGRTPEYIKKLCELAEGFEVNSDYVGYIAVKIYDAYFEDEEIIEDQFAFPLLLRRAVDGWNEKNPNQSINIDMFCLTNYQPKTGIGIDYSFKDYTPSGNLTAVEMAIEDCLQNVLREEVLAEWNAEDK